jgi:hypothetical protein
VTFFLLTVFFESDFECCLAEAVPAEVKSVLADVTSCSSAAFATLGEFPEFACFGDIVFEVFLVFCGLVLDLLQCFRMMRCGHLILRKFDVEFFFQEFYCIVVCDAVVERYLSFHYFPSFDAVSWTLERDAYLESHDADVRVILGEWDVDVFWDAE